MERKILFKAKRLDNDEWAEGYYVKKVAHKQTPKGDVVEDGEEHLIFGMTKTDVQPYWHEVDPSTVCQFTGIYDKDGNEIYEHDLVQKLGTKSIYEVVWNDVYACYSVLDRYNNVIASNNFADIRSEEMSIVGNIYDKQE